MGKTMSLRTFKKVRHYVLFFNLEVFYLKNTTVKNATLCVTSQKAFQRYKNATVQTQAPFLFTTIVPKYDTMYDIKLSRWDFTHRLVTGAAVLASLHEILVIQLLLPFIIYQQVYMCLFYT